MMGFQAAQVGREARDHRRIEVAAPRADGATHQLESDFHRNFRSKCHKSCRDRWLQTRAEWGGAGRRIFTAPRHAGSWRKQLLRCSLGPIQPERGSAAGGCHLGCRDTRCPSTGKLSRGFRHRRAAHDWRFATLPTQIDRQSRADHGAKCTNGSLNS